MTETEYRTMVSDLKSAIRFVKDAHETKDFDQYHGAFGGKSSYEADNLHGAYVVLSRVINKLSEGIKNATPNI